MKSKSRFLLLFVFVLMLTNTGWAMDNKQVESIVIDFKINEANDCAEDIEENYVTQDVFLTNEDVNNINFEFYNDKYSIRNIIDNDSRYEVGSGDFDKYIKFICYLSIEFPDGTYRGTGFVVGNNIVVTAAHCLYDSKLGGYAESIKVYPGRKNNQDNGVFTATKARLHVTNNYAYVGKAGLDIGLIELDRNIEKTTGKMNMKIVPETLCSKLVGQSVTICGYPSDITGIRQFTMKEKIKKVVNHSYDNINYFRVIHDVDTYSGQSGSAIHQDAFTAIGVHNGYLSTEKLNYGTLFNPILYNWILKYVNQ